MKIFLSWSGDVSHRVAMALEKWLPYVIQEIEPFSSTDINKGEKWNEILTDKLKEAQYGIICVTPYNSHKAWMNFEAGALARAIDVSCVVPFLFHVDPEELEGPLTEFQCAIYRKEDVFRMIQSLNRLLRKPLGAKLLENTFEGWWPQLDEELKGISLISEDETRAYYPWLYTREDALQSVADLAHYESVWIVTMDPGKYYDRSMKELILGGCKLGKQFRYFLPRSDDYERELKTMAQAHPQFSFKCFPTEHFETQASSDYIIFNAEGTGDQRVLVKIPLADHVHAEFWFKAGERSCRSFVSRFRDLWEAEDAKALT